ncbi:hypothetical protein KIW84_022492 [Lathyrus oleraceus]|uniref:B-like cyclin n=1 Tax=Pisum sativum TaxID=3888 RepID=A0A9D4YD97_PEA|nr:hypothetical protein KIW84_022492 [Pisum sativum]
MAGRIQDIDTILKSRANEIVDIDYNFKDPRFCASIANEIYENLCVSEKIKRPSIDFMEKIQTNINAGMRAMLIEWLVEVAEEYKLLSDTLLLAVNYLDRYLSSKRINTNPMSNPEAGGIEIALARALNNGLRYAAKLIASSESSISKSLSRNFRSIGVKKMGDGHGHIKPGHMHSSHAQIRLGEASWLENVSCSVHCFFSVLVWEFLSLQSFSSKRRHQLVDSSDTSLALIIWWIWES